MALKRFAFYAAFLLLYGLINAYIALRGGQAVRGSYPRLAWSWGIFVLIASLLFPVSRWLSQLLPHEISKILITAASYWLGAMYYLFFIILALDLVRLADHFINFLPADFKTPHPGVAAVMCSILLVIFSYGTWNACHPRIIHYDLSINKKSSPLDKMRIVMVSDIHLGWIVGINRLNSMVNSINSLQPDLVLLAGDIVDEGADLEAQDEIPYTFSRITARYGTFAVPGNHEYISGQVYRVGKFLQDAGVTVLRDRYIEVDNAFYLVGRDDLNRGGFSQKRRKDLRELLQGLDSELLPVILIDHQPFKLEEADQAGVDLQFSGHTHLGQFFPNNLITHKLYEQDWGYLRKDRLQAIISCGYGTWGPPIRIGNRPEIVVADVVFNK
ncbi:metallophosphoesterase [Syntrophomonas palmitatica]|uniref:metallophosphoesterase n=1 Tax=Syntrophomonas palmitatica TaxID=402877 RepID=UPI0006D08940|nr:metallophosphoesterase [Syntrophomonas palmitatica]